MPLVLPRKSALLAVSWDQRQVMYVLAHVTGGAVVVQAADTVTRQHDDGSSRPVAEILEEQLHEHGVKRAHVLVGLARSQVEMRDLTLPPATDEELPELVRNQTLHQSADITDDSAVDFIVLDDDSSQSRKVAAAVVTTDLLKSIAENATVAGQAPEGISLRPFSAASLCCRIVGPLSGKCLLVSRLENEADFSVISQGRVLFSRTIRLAADPSEEATARQMISEINRTLLVTPRASDDEGIVEHIYMFGSLAEQETLERMAEELDIAISLLNPLDGIQRAADAVPEDVYRYAGLVGMLRDHVDGTHAIDFVNPKRPPPPPNYRRKAAFYATAAVIVLAIGANHFWEKVHTARGNVYELASKVKSVEAVLEKTKQKTAIVDEIRRWQAQDVNWLDELRELAARFPVGNDAVVRRLTASPSTSVSGVSGVIDMQVHARDQSVLSEMEDQLRDAYHPVVRVQGVLQTSEEDAYGWQSEVTVYVRRRPKEQYAQNVSQSEGQESGEHAGQPADQVSQAEVQAERR